METYEQIMARLDKCEQAKDLNDRLKQKKFTKFDPNQKPIIFPHEEVDFNEENEYVA